MRAAGIMRAGLTVIFLLATLLPLTVAAADQEDIEKFLPEFHLDFRTFFLWQSDSDFDDSKPKYSESGQTVGYLSTLIRPSLMWNPHESIRVFYEIEVGDNVWSRNDANQGDPTGADWPVFRHRQFWGEVQIPNLPLWIKAGYSYFHDPTHLIADRYVGTADITGDWGTGKVKVGVAIIPDTTYEGNDPNQSQFDKDLEGYDPERNNFNNDDFFFFTSVRQEVTDWVFSPAVFYRWDKSEIRRLRWTLSPVLNATWRMTEISRLELDLAGQYGQYQNGGIGNRDVEQLAGAAQLRFFVDLKKVTLKFGGLFLSGDDDPDDLIDNAFRYSGFSKSPTVMLSENYIQDQHTNLDERAADQGVGLVLADFQVAYIVYGGPEIFAQAGYGTVLENKHLSDEAHLGWEFDLGWDIDIHDRMANLSLLGGVLMPGKAAAALKNEIDTEATEILWHVQTAMEIHF